MNRDVASRGSGRSSLEVSTATEPSIASKNRLRFPIGIADIATRDLPPTRTARARGLMRVPSQSGQTRVFIYLSR